MNYKKIILIIVFLAVSAGVFSINTSNVKAITVEELLLVQITSIETQIIQLQQQLTEIREDKDESDNYSSIIEVETGGLEYIEIQLTFLADITQEVMDRIIELIKK